MLRGKFIAIQAYLKKQEKSQINNLALHLKQLEKEDMKNPMVSRRKEILKIRAEINAKERKETIAKINKAKSWFFERINKIGDEAWSGGSTGLGPQLQASGLRAGVGTRVDDSPL